MNELVSKVPLFISSRLLSSLWVYCAGSTSDWCALQEALYKCIDTIQGVCFCAVGFSMGHQWSLAEYEIGIDWKTWRCKGLMWVAGWQGNWRSLFWWLFWCLWERSFDCATRCCLWPMKGARWWKSNVAQSDFSVPYRIDGFCPL